MVVVIEQEKPQIRLQIVYASELRKLYLYESVKSDEKLVSFMCRI